MVAESSSGVEAGRRSRPKDPGLPTEKMSNRKSVGQGARKKIANAAPSPSTPATSGTTGNQVTAIPGNEKVSGRKCASQEINARGKGSTGTRLVNNKLKVASSIKKTSTLRDRQNERSQTSGMTGKGAEAFKDKDNKDKPSDGDKSVKNQESKNTQRNGKITKELIRKRNKATVSHDESSDDSNVNFDFSEIEKKIFEGVSRQRDLTGKRSGGKHLKISSRTKTSRDDSNRTKTSGDNSNRTKKSRGINNSTKTESTKSKECVSPGKENVVKRAPRGRKEKEDPSGGKKGEASLRSNKKHDRSKSNTPVGRGKEAKKSSRSGEEKRSQSRVTKGRNGSKDKSRRSGGRRKTKTDPGSDSDMSDWEEVEAQERDGADEARELEECGDVRKEEGVRIELDAPELLWGMKKRKRRTEEDMIEEYLRKRVNRSIKEVYENMHKTHLLCLLAHGRYVNQALNSEVLLAAALSLVVDKNVYPPKRLDLGYLQKFVAWFGRKIVMSAEALEKDYWSREVSEALAGRFESKTARTCREVVLMFVVICRALGMNVRLVLALQPLRWKPGTEVLMKKGKKANDGDDDGREKEGEKKGEFPEGSLSSQASTSKVETKEKKGRKMLSSDYDRGNTPRKKNVPPKKKKSEEQTQKRKGTSDDEWDSDFDPNVLKVNKGPKSLSSQRRRSSEKRKSTDGESEGGGKKRKVEALVEWAEVYVEEEEKWVCVDVVRGKFHCVAEIEARMPTGTGYIIVFNSNLTVKDVTRRYVTSWLSSENKLRCDSKWWGLSVGAFRGQRSRLDKEENLELDQNLRQQPMPKIISEYKNHPLYALQRHLLKFDGIYPPNRDPIGFIKGEAVYPRESIRQLHSRDTWMKEAKSVRVDEEPYKTVKARPKWDRNTNQVIKDRPLELFGEWQVEDYEPPVAKDGKVPRNDYGNVELYKPSMLPRGCVHIPINGLSKVARKLEIDCAPAMVGFDFHSGWTHPVYDGYVVCEEFREVLMDAWNQEQAEQARRAEEKREKRIYDNWRRLIKGMVVRARLREEYKAASDDDDEEEVEEKINKECKQDTKRKIKQEDIDALRLEGGKNLDMKEDKSQDEPPPPLITHQIRNLKIDLCSNIVEMVKKSRQRTMKTKNSVKRKPGKKREGGKKQGNKEEMEDESDNTSESDQEEKKEKIRAILSWGTNTVVTNPELSDDSDAGVKPGSTSSLQPQLSNPFFASIISPVKDKAKKERKKAGRQTKTNEASEGSEADASSSRSTTPEPETSTLNNVGSRRLSSRRSVKKKSGVYVESEYDISRDSSDCEDRSYNPDEEKMKV